MSAQSEYSQQNDYHFKSIEQIETNNNNKNEYKKKDMKVIIDMFLYFNLTEFFNLLLLKFFIPY